MSRREHADEQKLLDAAGATGIGVIIPVMDFRHIVLSLNTPAASAGTIKVKGSIMKDRPTFGASPSVTDRWDFIQIKDLEDGSALDGDTGIVLASGEHARLFEVNTNGLTYLVLDVTVATSGSFTAYGTLFTN